MHRRKIFIDNALRQRFIRHNVTDVSLHGLPRIEDPALLVLPSVRRLQVLICQFFERVSPVCIPGAELLCNPVKLLLGFIHRQDALYIVRLAVECLLRNLSPQQLPNQSLVLICQKIFCRNLFIVPLFRFELIP